MQTPPLVTVTYEDPSGLASRFLPLLKAKLPLAQLHWKSSISSQSSIRTISQLGLKLVPIQSLPDQQHQFASGIDRPYLNLYLVQCEDAESYKTTVRQQIRTWFNAVAVRKDQEWMIIHCVSATAESLSRSGPKLLGLRNSVTDRIRSDFNISATKRDQCARLNLAASSAELEEEMAALLSRLKVCLVSSIDKRVLEHQERIAKMDSQRTLPGWNYFTYFVLKEDLVDTFENISLYEESLFVLDELEATFIELQEAGVLDFVASHSTSADAISKLPDMTLKPYRQSIMQSQISLLDFSTYLFSRQATALRACQLYRQVLSRSLAFIASVSRLVQAQSPSDPWIAHCWTITSVTAMLDYVKPDPEDEALASACADLHVLSRQSLSLLHKLVQDDKTLLERLPSTLSESLAEANYEARLLDITRMIISEYSLSGRENAVAVWTAELARLYAARQDWKETASLLSQIPDSLARLDSLCELHLNALREVGNKDAYMYAILEAASRLKNKAFKRDYLSDLSALALESERTHLELSIKSFATITVGLFPKVSLQSIELEVHIDWLLHVLVGPWTVVIELLNEQGQSLQMQAQNVIFQSGPQLIRASSNIIRPGFYRLCSVSLTLGALQLSQRDLTSTDLQYNIAIFSPPDLHVSLRRPRLMHVRHSKPAMTIEITSAKKLPECRLELVPVGTSKIDISTLKVDDDCSAQASHDHGAVLFSAQAGSTTRLTVEYQSDSAKLSVHATLSYQIDGITSTWQAALDAHLGLPLAVNVQDFFRAAHLLSLFKVAPNTETPYILERATLSSQATEESAESPAYENLSVCPGRPVQLFFKISAKCKSKVFDLELTYRSPVEELEALIQATFLKLGKERDAPGELLGLLHHSIQDRLAGFCDLQASLVEKNIVRQSFVENDWTQMMTFINPGNQAMALDIIKSIYTDALQLVPGPARLMRITVDIPTPATVHTIQIKPNVNKATLNEYLSATLRISASNARTGTKESCKYWFEVDLDESLWILACKRRGELLFLDGEFSLDLGLIPLAIGYLTLPRVEVFSLDPDAVNEMHQRSSSLLVVSDRDTQEKKIDLARLRPFVAAS